MLSNEFDTSRSEPKLPIESGVGSIIVFKLCTSIAYLHENIFMFMSKVQHQYIPTHIANNVFITDLYQIYGDTSYFICLYSDKYLYLILLGLILLFSMVGVVLIIHQDEGN